MKKLLTHNIVWYFLIGLSCVVTILFFSKTAFQLSNYTKLNKKTVAKVISWEINEMKDGTYVIGAAYHYFVKDKKFEGKSLFKSKKFVNYYTALDELTKISKNDLKIWYSSKNMSLSDLERPFPVKNLIYTCLTSSICLYFLFLKNKNKEM